MLTAVALAFLVNVAGAAFNWIFKKAGRLATQVALFAVALAFAAYTQWGVQFPGVVHIVEVAAIIFSMAVTFYEVLLSKFSMFSGPQA